MSEFVKAAKAGDLQDGSKIKVTVAGKEIMLAKIGGNHYAVANKCPHMGGSLSAGQLEGTVVTCPRHGSQFDVTNGKVVRWLKGSGPVTAIFKALKSPRPVVTYKVKVAGEDILIEV